MADLPTSAELARRAQAAIRADLDPDGTGAVNLNPGSRNDVLVSAITGASARVARGASDRLAQIRLSSSTGDALDTVAWDLFKEQRKPASKAVGTAYLQRASGGATYIPQGSRFAAPGASPSAVNVLARADVIVGSGVLSVAVPCEAESEGQNGNIALSALTVISDALPDSGWTLYVPSPGDPVLAGGVVDVFGGGDEAESDDTFRERLEQLSIAAAWGVYEGLLRGALRVPGVRYVTLVEPGDGTAVCYAGDASLNLPSALRAAIDTAALGWRSFGTPLIVRPYTRVDVAVTATLHMSRALSSYDVEAIRAEAVRRTLDYFRIGRPQPDEYYRNRIEAAILGAHDEAQDVTLAAPVADVQRPADSSYGALTTLNRYTTSAGLVSVDVQGPRTA